MTTEAVTLPDVEDVRADVRAWLEGHWDPDRPLLEWRGLLVDSGWACPSWPREWYGRGLPPAMDGVVAEELARIGAVGTPTGVGMGLAGPTMLTHGSEACVSTRSSTPTRTTTASG